MDSVAPIGATIANDIDNKSDKPQDKSNSATSTGNDVDTKPSRVKTYVVEDEHIVPFLLRVLLLTVLSILPALVFGVLFTYIGWGATVHKFLVQQIMYARMLGAFGAFIFIWLYVLDFSYWNGIFFICLKNILLLTSGLSIYGSGIFFAKEYPSMPLLLFLLSCPSYYALLRVALFRKVVLPHFLIALAYALFIGGSMGLGIWVWWVQTTGWFWPGKSDHVKIQFYEFMDCELPPHVNSTVILPSAPKLKSCQSAFLLWSGLMIASFSVISFSFVSYFLGKSLQAKSAKKAGTMARVFSVLMMIGFAGMWTAGSIAGSSLSMSNMVMTFSFGFLVCAVASVAGTVGVKNAHGEFINSKLAKRLSGAMKSDWAKAMLFFTSPLYIMFLLLSMLNQFFRVYLTPCTNRLLNDNDKLVGWKKSWTTMAVHRQIDGLMKWEWTSVLKKVQFIGILYFSFSVIIGKITYIILSELNVMLQSYPLWMVTIIFFSVGLTMFLNPAIPGVPVYLVGGVLLVGSAEVTFGFWIGAVYTCFVCFFIKLTAVAMQQKCFGEKLGSKVWVRQIVGVNSISIRAIKLILEKPGLNMAKVSILCGGPDWPTSVLTGILRLSVVQMQIGTLPIMGLIAPCVFAGAFQLKAGTNVLYTSLSTVALGAASGSQSLALLAAMFYIDKTVSARREELEKIPDDVEVKLADERSAEKAKRVREITQWKSAAPHARFLLIIGAVASNIYCLVFGFASSRCFENYAITDTVKDKLNGSTFNIVRGMFGWSIIGLVGFSILTYYLIGMWANKLLQKHSHDDDEVPHPFVAKEVVTQSKTKIAPRWHDTNEEHNRRIEKMDGATSNYNQNDSNVADGSNNNESVKFINEKKIITNTTINEETSNSNSTNAKTLVHL